LPCAQADLQHLLQRLLVLAARLRPKQLVTSKRGPKTGRANAGYVSGCVARSHVSTDLVIKGATKDVERHALQTPTGPPVPASALRQGRCWPAPRPWMHASRSFEALDRRS